LTNPRITQALTRLFDKHRIVFWHDTQQEFRTEFDSLDLPDVQCITVANNEFGLKYRILREEPQQKFLLYQDGPLPARDTDNWLLDVQLAYGEFHTDQTAIWLSDLELGLDFAPVVQQHTEFFQSAKRLEKLKASLQPDDTQGQIRLKMLAVCAGSDPGLDAVVVSLLQDLANEDEDAIHLIERCHLATVLWEQMARCYGYQSESPGVRDFAIELFKSCYAMGTDGPVKLNGDALVFLKRWKDSRRFEVGFVTLSKQCAQILDIERDLTQRDFRDLMALDYFRLIDQKIISDLVRSVVARTVSSGEVSQWVRQRRQSHWYQGLQDLYEAIEQASLLTQALAESDLRMGSLAEGVQRYSQHWYRLDQHYRKFIFHVRKSGQASLMGLLLDQIENLYTNNFLLALGDGFQQQVEQSTLWQAQPIKRQDAFFRTWVQPFLDKDIKVCVIISDAMRYEVGEELLGRIRQEDRYGAALEPALSMLPSYTQLGMAALLPHQTLAIADDNTGTVLADGQSTQGTANRTKILQAALRDRGMAIKSDEFMQLNRDDSRELLKANDVVYLYHNRIDHTGDKMHSEGQAFEAADATLDDLLRLVKKLTAANVSNILITADHGFIYQDRELAESDFLAAEVTGQTILYRDRRFVLGKGLSDSPSLHGWTSAQLGLDGDIEIRIPKSINRLRLKGSGSRFVHGGATLQEAVIPVLKINKKRQSDITQVEVEILRGASAIITSGQLAVTLYQTEAVTDKIQPRSLRAGIYTESGELISDRHTQAFDLVSDNPRERELPLRFVLSRKADAANGQEVILRLDEQVPGTTHYREYKTLRYTMRRSFTSDFDF